ncbi:NAD(P)-dependent dehydrogenase (short-subunit alcohol dehydrogenase family) [Microvirga flocculans]|uniref:NAD(P)-dependent dehydrogenase (Short-subunit alcohol dehydrogenase family) n=1 Tax=Microvirga flocculans TaxID=217168 RepID=A0A7W6N9I6_9HYPH|nr:SDR family NAD(P)-dependent oxidoreductase [Microvirga flocculans]MBB4041508.1 NAD(P)-dependent dehydrogenase (short-subunit alcohol dehydrogenase family) [Microvirga flocculans]
MTQSSFAESDDLLRSLDRPSRALVVGASGGIGSAFTQLLALQGFESVHALSRRMGTGEGPGVRPGRIDIEHESSIAAAAQSLAEGAPVRLIVVATGLLHDSDFQPEKTYRSLDPEKLARSFRVNAIGPALVAKHMLPLLPKNGKSVFAVVSARVGSIEDNRLGGWYGYRASKAALNQFMRTLSIELRRQKPDAICVALHPGTVDTALSEPFQAGVEEGKLFAPHDAAQRLLAVIEGLTSADTGQFFAWDGRTIPF